MHVNMQFYLNMHVGCSQHGPFFLMIPMAAKVMQSADDMARELFDKEPSFGELLEQHWTLTREYSFWVPLLSLILKNVRSLRCFCVLQDSRVV